MLLHKKCSMIFAIATVSLASCAYATSPTSLQSQHSLMSNLEESSDWIICEITQTNLLKMSAKQSGAIAKATCQDDDREVSFMAGHKMELEEQYLIFNANADFLLLADYSFPSDNIKAPDRIIEASKLGSISGGLRVIDVKVNQTSKKYVMVPRVWASPVKNYTGVGVVRRDHSIILPCGVEDCNSNEVGYYLVPAIMILEEEGPN